MKKLKSSSWRCGGYSFMKPKLRRSDWWNKQNNHWMKKLFFFLSDIVYNSVAQLCHPKQSDLSSSDCNCRFCSFSHLHQLFRSCRFFSFFLLILRLHSPPLSVCRCWQCRCASVYIQYIIDWWNNWEETADRHPGPLLCCQITALGPILLFVHMPTHTLWEESSAGSVYRFHELFFEVCKVWNVAWFSGRRL